MASDLKLLIDWVVENWDNIDDKHKVDLHYQKRDYEKTEGDKIPDVELNVAHRIVILLVDRQKPSVEANYSFDEERIGITKDGTIIWGFDSGCSCPTPWGDSYPSCYEISKSWKEFEVKNIEQFDKGATQEIENKITEIILTTKAKS